MDIPRRIDSLLKMEFSAIFFFSVHTIKCVYMPVFKSCKPQTSCTLCIIIYLRINISFKPINPCVYR